MKKRTIDARGKLCPEPLMMTRRAIKEAAQGDTIEVITDNDIACKNIGSYLTEMKIAFTEANGQISFIVGNHDTALLEAIPACPTKPANDNGYVIVIKSQEMGSEDANLGKLLMRAFLNTVAESDKLPQTIIIYSGGIRLTMVGTDTARSLAKLEEKGVEVVICGTCVDFYQLKESIKIGTISNMFVIVEKMANATNIVYP